MKLLGILITASCMCVCTPASARDTEDLKSDIVICKTAVKAGLNDPTIKTGDLAEILFKAKGYNPVQVVEGLGLCAAYSSGYLDGLKKAQEIRT